MRSQLQTVLGVLVLMVWVACASVQVNAGSARRLCPGDLHVHYEWQEGSLPPPYHFEYSIDIQAAGEGRIVMIPDYPAEGPPVWTESFAVDRTSLDRLCETMVAEGLWTEKWQTQAQPPVGGSSQSLTVAADRQTATIPAFPIARQKEQAEAIFNAVKLLVPKAIWTKLDAQRRKYQAERA